MFNADFYPTPEEVIYEMFSVDTVKNKIVLEPHAGKGDLVKEVKRFAKKVIGCELDPELYKIASTYCDEMIGTDFLKITSDQVSHVDVIIMNPPFKTGGYHILHAWKIAPPGCKIIALCNYETINNPHTQARKELVTIIESNGTIENLGNCFSTAERTTNVEVALIKLGKPVADNYEDEFKGFFDEEEQEEPQVNGIMSYNAIREIVNRYVAAVKIYDEQLEIGKRLYTVLGGCFKVYDEDDKYHDQVALAVTATAENFSAQRERFKKVLQKSGWKWIFKKMNLQKYSTKGLKEDINKFVETQMDIPFTMKNIYKMLEIVVATTGQRMDRSIIELFDKLTQYTHENRYNVPGFKTNSEYLVTKRFIMSYATETAYDSKHVRLNRHGRDGELLMDMEKALCFITGVDWDEINKHLTKEEEMLETKPLKGIWLLEQKLVPGDWYDTYFFRIKCYKKGTAHVEFRNEDDWAIFNQNVARIKGYVIPEFKEKTKYQKKQTFEKEAAPML